MRKMSLNVAISRFSNNEKIYFIPSRRAQKPIETCTGESFFIKRVKQLIIGVGGMVVLLDVIEILHRR